MLKKLISALALLLLPVSVQAVPYTVIYITDTSQATWSVPSDWNSSDNLIEAIGGGGSANGWASYGAGGGGAAYSASTNVTLTASSSVGIQVGLGGVDGGAANGEDTWLCNSTSNCATIGGSAVQVGAKGGSAPSSQTGGVGGASGSGVGATKYSGGNGSNGVTSTTTGSGGGAGGPFGVGGAGTSPFPGGTAGGGFGGAGGWRIHLPGDQGTDWDDAHGSGGGAAAEPGGGGIQGGIYGGGGGGGASGGGPGGQGVLRISYCPAASVPCSAVKPTTDLAFPYWPYWGGPAAYWGQWSVPVTSGWNSDTFFPIGIWILDNDSLANDQTTASYGFNLGFNMFGGTNFANIATAGIFAAPSGDTEQAASSTSTVTVGTGSKTFSLTSITQTPAVNDRVVIKNTADESGSGAWMAGQVTSYSAPSVTVNVTASNGSGSLSSWNYYINHFPIRNTNLGNESAIWAASDESDLTFSAGSATWSQDARVTVNQCVGASACGYSVMQTEKSWFASDRPFSANFGGGIDYFQSASEVRGFLTGSGSWSGLDAFSTDHYYYTQDGGFCAVGKGGKFITGLAGAGVLTTNQCYRSSMYGITDDWSRIVSHTNPNFQKVIPQFTYIEQVPQPGTFPITTAQIQGAAVSGLIHGSQGVIFFGYAQSTWIPTCNWTFYNMIEGYPSGWSDPDCDTYVATARNAAALNPHITAFARMLNGRRYRVDYNAPGLDSSTWYNPVDGHVYIWVQQNGVPPDFDDLSGTYTMTLPTTPTDLCTGKQVRIHDWQSNSNMSTNYTTATPNGSCQFDVTLNNEWEWRELEIVAAAGAGVSRVTAPKNTNSNKRTTPKNASPKCAAGVVC